MDGDLIIIIYNFFGHLLSPYFVDDYCSYFDITNGIFAGIINRGITGNDNIWNGINNSCGIDLYEYGIYLVPYVLTSITIVILILLLFRLFKWIFNLIFKLFRLN